MKFNREKIEKFISFQRIFGLIKKETIQILRDKVTLKMIIMIPLIQLFLYGFAINSDPKNLPTVILSYDNSLLARNIVTGMRNSEYFKILPEIQTSKEGKKLLQEGKVNFVLTIPENFSRDLLKSSGINPPKLLIEADATDPIAVSSALGYISQIIQFAIQKDPFPTNFLGAQTSNNSKEFSNIKSKDIFTKNQNLLYELRIHKLYNEEGISKWNVIPGLIAIILTFTALNMTSLSFAKEREAGTIENLLAMPLKPLEIMIGKTTPFIFIGYIQSIIILLVSYFFLGIPIIGNPLLLALAVLIFIICNLILGFSISIQAKTQMQAMQSSMFFFLPSILLSGFIFPFRGMPLWAQFIGNGMPTTYFIRIMKGVMLKGSNFQEILTDLWPLSLILLILSLFSIKIYKRTLD